MHMWNCFAAEVAAFLDRLGLLSGPLCKPLKRGKWSLEVQFGHTVIAHYRRLVRAVTAM